jgi:pyruvate dehydrogenase E2 component (dihydrolipoamide acetyltransferase)
MQQKLFVTEHKGTETMPVKILMPALSPTMTDGTLAKWHVGEGDTINSGDVIAEIETDKATMEVEAVEEGRMGKLLVADGTENVAVNAVIALLLEDGESEADLSTLDEEPSSATATSEPAVSSAPLDLGTTLAPPIISVPASITPITNGERVFASPLARRMAEQAKLDIGIISGSGPNGRIVKSDVEAALSGGLPTITTSAAPIIAAVVRPNKAEYELVIPSNMRKIIAERLTESKQTVPHFYLTADCQIDNLLSFRKELNDKADNTYKLSVNDIIIKAAAVALKKVPEANSSWADEGLKLFKSSDISVAVAIKDGLVTPVIRHAEAKGLEEISNEMRELASKAREGKLQPEEYQGGTFSISNLGMFGVKQFDAVINPPQACMLAVGAGEQRPVVKDGALAVAKVMSCTLSVDHRAVDGAVGADYLACLKGLLENPVTMLL